MTALGGQNYSIYFREHDNEWANIKNAVVHTYEVLEEQVEHIAERDRSGIVQHSMRAVIDEMKTMLGQMNI